MAREREATRKPLSFSTTMRNPDRIVDYLRVLSHFENKKLTNEIIMDIVRKLIKKRCYCPVYVNRTSYLKNVIKEDEASFSDSEVNEIITNSPQNHKEAGFEKGWPSRFDTMYKLPKEFGFVYYEMGKPIQISNVGHMLIDAVSDNGVDNEKIQNVFLNALIKYQACNPFRKNSTPNVPLPLLLRVISLLKNKCGQECAGVFIQEISIFVCWPNNDAQKLFEYIVELRDNFRFTYSPEYIYERCLELLGVGDAQRNRFKMIQITHEAVDEYIRKMRSTGIISLRGNGRFIDFNMLEIEKINYVLKHYGQYKEFASNVEYFSYMGTIDFEIVDMEKKTTEEETNIKQATLNKFAQHYTKRNIYEELKKVCKNTASSDSIFKYISAPARLEFLTSISLKQNFPTIDVIPNYKSDDEGLPTCTAAGGIADIVCRDSEYNSLFEVTLMRGRIQVVNEIIPIRRHLLEAVKQNKKTFSVFLAPQVHEDAKEAALWYKLRDNIDICTYGIDRFISEIGTVTKIKEFCTK